MNIQLAWKAHGPERNAMAQMRLMDFFSIIYAASVQSVGQTRLVRPWFARRIWMATRCGSGDTYLRLREAAPAARRANHPALVIVACPALPAKIFRLTRRANQMH
jgi:hypothetical protein